MRFSIKNLVASVGLIGCLAASAGVSAQEMKMADIFPPAHPIQKEVWDVFIDNAAALSNGEIKITNYPGAVLGSPGEQLNTTMNGVADIAFLIPGYTASNFPMTLLTELVVDNDTATAKITENLDFLKNEFKRVHLLSLWTNAGNILYTREKPVRSLADVKGMKIRGPSRNAGLVVESWGAVAVSIPGPEVYSAMSTGVIDGVLTEPSGTYGLKLVEVSDYITQGMNATILSAALIMNRDIYNSLSDANKAAIDQAGRENSVHANQHALAAEAKARAVFAEAGKEWIDLSPEAIAEFNAASEAVVEEAVKAAEEKGMDARAFVEALRK